MSGLPDRAHGVRDDLLHARLAALRDGEQRFGAAFEFRRIWPFIRQNIGNYLLAIIVYLIARTLGGVGTFLLCIGVIFTGFWSFLITAHGFAQVYRLATQPKE